MSIPPPKPRDHSHLIRAGFQPHPARRPVQKQLLQRNPISPFLPTAPRSRPSDNSSSRPDLFQVPPKSFDLPFNHITLPIPHIPSPTRRTPPPEAPASPPPRPHGDLSRPEDRRDDACWISAVENARPRPPPAKRRRLLNAVPIDIDALDVTIDVDAMDAPINVDGEEEQGEVVVIDAEDDGETDGEGGDVGVAVVEEAEGDGEENTKEDAHGVVLCRVSNA